MHYLVKWHCMMLGTTLKFVLAKENYSVYFKQRLVLSFEFQIHTQK